MASRCSEMDTRKNSQRLCQHTENLHRAKLQKVPAMRRGRGHSPTPNQETIFHWYLLLRENCFSPMEHHWAYQSRLRMGSMLVSSWSSHTKKGFCGFCFVFSIFVLFSLFFCFLFGLFSVRLGGCIFPCFFYLFVCFSVFLIFRNRERNMKLSGERGGKDMKGVREEKWLPSKHEDLRSCPQHSYKKLSTAMHICNPSTGKWGKTRQMDPCLSLSSQASQIDVLQSNKRPCLKN